jgi:AhpD family alkylhydroperoxidase
MAARIDMQAVAESNHEVYTKVAALEQYNAANLDHRLYELIKLRASYLNGCAYCIDMHSTNLMKSGERPELLFGVAAWHETEFFTPKERAALALTDAVTKISEAGVPDGVWDRASEFWSDKELVDLIAAIATINVWNRLAISTRIPPASSVSSGSPE